MVSTPIIPAENYHLKWDSHLNYLNSSIFTIFKNEKYADVMLLTSDQGPAIPAHRIILSSYSQFFASIFEANNVPASCVMYIILPSDLSRRAINILLQYMYSGEATVANDILNEVLHGGEVLKIRGLCRGNTSTRNQDTINCRKRSSNSDVNNHTELKENGCITPVPFVDSPVVVRSPQRTQQMSSMASFSTKRCCSEQILTINKEIADPADIPLTSHHENVFVPNPASMPKENFRRITESPNKIRSLNSISNQCNYLCREICSYQKEHLQRRYSENSERFSLNNNIEDSIQSLSGRKSLEIRTELPNIESSFIRVKQEPIDFLGEPDDESGSLIQPLPLDVVKIETSNIDNNEDERNYKGERNDNLIYSPLTCEVCGATFTVPGEWVHHIESHVHSETRFLPKKRRRLSATTNNLAALKCDLCKINFSTPAEWVRHIQETHTEAELAMCNKKDHFKVAKRICLLKKFPFPIKIRISQNYLTICTQSLLKVL